jgi:hypothetical protein
MTLLNLPPVRRLRVFATDPQASSERMTAALNITTITLPWAGVVAEDSQVERGPVNAYLEVIDVDPISGRLYPGVDLNDPHLLAQDGLAPSEGNPQFHQQMVFAVAMKTIRHFEFALGRRVFWRPMWDNDSKSYKSVERLRIHPHALREPNAYYSIDKLALLFGYFRASTDEAGKNLPGGWIFTALSHDIIVHETTHAILDGLHRRYSEATNPDSLAFHEAFADMIALLSRFTLPELVRSAIISADGRLDSSSILSRIAQQVGEATGRKSPIRDAIDTIGLGEDPDRSKIKTEFTPHGRGGILVAAIFDALVSIYNTRTEDLLRMARIEVTHAGKPLLPHELIERLTKEAMKAGQHLMNMCIRALDYMPAVDVTFGDFLRALITADTDLVPDDKLYYRLSVIDGFRKRGIFPDSCLSLAPDSLIWEAPENADLLHVTDLPGLNGQRDFAKTLDLRPKFNRVEAFDAAEANRQAIWWWLIGSDYSPSNDDPYKADKAWEGALGIKFLLRPFDGEQKPFRTLLQLKPGSKSELDMLPRVEVHSVRMTRRAGPDGQDLPQLIIEVTQRRRGFFDPEVQKAQDSDTQQASAPDFWFRGGAVIVIDLRDLTIRYIIRKRIDSDDRLERQRSFVAGVGMGLAATYGMTGLDNQGLELFAMTHEGLIG